MEGANGCAPPVVMDDPSPDVVRTVFQRRGHSTEEYQRENDKRFSLLLGKYFSESRTSTNDWCSCGKCRILPTVRDNLCCRDVCGTSLRFPAKMAVVEHLRKRISEMTSSSCITEHPDFDTVVLNEKVV
ncbi:hypothetical protein OESDEN_05076 [Oesophagostomum dentatum]|uniref:P2X purinoreceptor 7 intracellular domain-containing protein n=1 Tax=Oesophagostomum dentatum TaxID=61180 RepID=A0A0B1TCH4_OESDE|nr:hypothetical protein OESDEN_05076 [Oesophagostomum dentatum]